jgi:hypothetical protein
MLAKPILKPVPPTGENRAVAPGRKPNSEYRKREHLTPAEVAKLTEAAKDNLRASEVCDLERSAIDFTKPCR